MLNASYGRQLLNCGTEQLRSSLSLKLTHGFRIHDLVLYG